MLEIKKNFLQNFKVESSLLKDLIKSHENEKLINKNENKFFIHCQFKLKTLKKWVKNV